MVGKCYIVEGVNARDREIVSDNKRFLLPEQSIRVLIKKKSEISNTLHLKIEQEYFPLRRVNKNNKETINGMALVVTDDNLLESTDSLKNS